MKHITINNVTQPISSLIMGSDYFTPDNQEKVNSVIDSFIDIGGNTIDTAFIYAGGQSEAAIGNWIDQGNRGRINVWTKGGHPNQNGHTINRDELQEQLKVSLDRLKSESVELYALHRDDPTVRVEDILEWLNEHVQSKRIQAFGASNWSVERLEEANTYAEKNGLAGFSFSSPNLSLAKAKEPYWPGCVSVNQQMINWHEKSQLPLFSWSSQARGFFTGRFTRDNLENEDLVRVFYNDENWERYDRAEKLASEKGCSLIEIALAYVLNQKFPTGAIIGPQNREELQSCGEGAKITLTTEEVAWINLNS
ncbi:aldo/keto reductase [Alkalicoccobacillus murimartini]|uniref:Aryl-alcohol dehydrogenase-like predicted oxidoreductase n=1 Tax=Alkalicoccobacillus murimartini TaxID=171685 RepID=A0ABT9YEL4_9BACI|nr:aldo/keto reductase [Alkalicoccobacillus murimartini]MDQ0206171.1 aryl-alcohol dehydrogenase-like predicted oxidoreductase [Alkalicoccobacillus murimartini]